VVLFPELDDAEAKVIELSAGSHALPNNLAPLRPVSLPYTFPVSLKADCCKDEASYLILNQLQSARSLWLCGTTVYLTFTV